MPTMRSPGFRVIAVEADSPFAIVAVASRVFVDVATGKGLLVPVAVSTPLPPFVPRRKLISLIC